METAQIRTNVRLGDPVLEELLLGPVVVLMVGPAGAGKSTVARELSVRHPHLVVVSYDQEQGDGGVVDEAAVVRTQARLARRCAGGLGAVVDGTHRQLVRRAAVLRIAAEHQLPTVALVVLPSLERCLHQQALRARLVPETDVRAHHAAVTDLLPALPSEGYDLVAVLDHTATGCP